MGAVMAARKAKSACPICGKPQSTATRPFCSKRCADRDLGKWLNGDYRIPTEERSDTMPGPEDKDADEGG